MANAIDYGTLMHHAMRGLIRQVLDGIAHEGLPGDHHFFITLNTHHPDVEMAEWLRARYPDEITIVIQNWFEDLVVEEEGFAITLNFGNAPERLYVPFDAISTFVDPSVEFGLRFETQIDDEDEESAEEDDAEAPMSVAEETPDTPREAEVVSLDKFRK
ncbi:SspB family protein [Alkalilacustris brevis]|uniref:SspB family protein n=1 Tax=Alkalilacustris brevis TaxID=2026338 RepID=UPI000E0DC52A|nr:ClpXP protease specificity-enhancing factor SspB [Alkalilacustris brevis]